MAWRTRPAWLLAPLACALAAACGGGGAADAADPPVGDAPGTPVALADCGLEDFRNRALERINGLRAAGASCASAGSFAPAAALRWNGQLDQAAAAHAQGMLAADGLSHTDAQGRDAAQRVAATGYDARRVAENIAGGPYTIDAVVGAWMASPPHCANLMQPDLRDMALACASRAGSTFGHYWVLDLAQPR